MISTIKPFEELEFTDDFMFYQVLQNDEICKKLLERICRSTHSKTFARKNTGLP